MSKTMSLDTCEAIINEVDKAVQNKSRTIVDINNSEAKQIIKALADYSIVNGIPNMGIAAGIGKAVGIGAISSGAIGGTLASTTGGVTAGLVGGGATFATGSAAAGAVAGSSVPIVGTIIGAGVGLIIGVAIGSKNKKKQEQRKKALSQEAIKKQNSQINKLKDEVNELKDKIDKKDQEIERLEYLLGLLKSFDVFADALKA